MISQETIGVTVTFKEPVTFHLRMIGVQEEQQLRQKLFGLTEEEKTEKSYQNNVDLLASLSVKMPEGLFPHKPEEMTKSDQAKSPETFIEDFVTAQYAIEKFFEEKTVVKERIAEYAVRAYFVRLQPDVSFL